MNNPLSLERYRRQLDACCGRRMTAPKPITGIERMELEQQSEQDETTAFWTELTDSFRE